MSELTGELIWRKEVIAFYANDLLESVKIDPDVDYSGCFLDSKDEPCSDIEDYSYVSTAPGTVNARLELRLCKKQDGQAGKCIINYTAEFDKSGDGILHIDCDGKEIERMDENDKKLIRKEKRTAEFYRSRERVKQRTLEHLINHEKMFLNREN